LPDAVERICLSNIIKSSKADNSVVGEYQFKPIRHALIEQHLAEPEGTGFVPMGIFDTSELELSAANRPVEPEEPEGPPMVTLTEQDLEGQLRQSFENGLIEGKNLAERGLLNVFRALRSAAEGVETLREKVLRDSEDEIIKLVMLIAKKVIQREVTQDRSILSEVVRAALAAVPERDQIIIRLNPDDHAMITAGRGEILRRELITERMQLKLDPTVQPGGCQIDTEMGTINATIDAQLEEIFRRMQEERTQGQHVLEA